MSRGLGDVYKRQGLAFVRLVLHPGRRDNQRYFDEWAARLERWLEEGVDAWMMIHCPNNLHCPELAIAFHETLRRRLAGGAPGCLPAWPVPEQGSLL